MSSCVSGKFRGVKEYWLSMPKVRGVSTKIRILLPI